MVNFLLLIILLFTTTNSVTAAGNPINWPWKGVTSDVMTIEREPNIVKFLDKQNIRFVRIHISVSDIMQVYHLSPSDALNKALHNAKVYSGQLYDAGITSALSVSDFPVMGNKCILKSKKGYWDMDGICVNQIYNFVKITVDFMSESKISAYEFLAEPVTKVKLNLWQDRYVQPKEWIEICQNIIKLTREKDTEKWLIISLGPWAFPDNYDKFIPFNDKKVIYDIHMYQPLLYTMQGIKGKNEGVGYPGVVKTREIFPTYDKYPQSFWDKKLLSTIMEPLEMFHKKYDVPIIVGEFGAVLWARNREEYLHDLISIFNKNKWGWAYFNIGSRWHGFDPRFNAVKKQGKYDFIYQGDENKAMRLLLPYFKNNEM